MLALTNRSSCCNQTWLELLLKIDPFNVIEHLCRNQLSHILKPYSCLVCAALWSNIGRRSLLNDQEFPLRTTKRKSGRCQPLLHTQTTALHPLWPGRFLRRFGRRNLSEWGRQHRGDASSPALGLLLISHWISNIMPQSVGTRQDPANVVELRFPNSLCWKACFPCFWQMDKWCLVLYMVLSPLHGP